MVQTCKQCGEEKPLTEFYKQSRASTHWLTCKSCTAKQREATGNERTKRYGVTPVAYRLMLFAQDGGCAICGKKNNGTAKAGSKRGFALDHDHACCPEHKACKKCVRGLLCNNCNKGLGLFKDNPTFLTNAINYLHKHAATKNL